MQTDSRYPWGKGTPRWLRDATTDDSDKSWTVPAGKLWDLRSIQFTIANSATAGNRTVRAYITDGTNRIWGGAAMDVVTAGTNSTGAWLFGQGAGAPAAVIQQRLDMALDSAVANWLRGAPQCLLSSGSVVRVYDSSAVSAAFDDLFVVLHYVEYDA